MLVHCIIWLVIGSAIYLNAILFCQKHNKWGVVFHNSGHGLALGHVKDMRGLEKVHAFLFVWLDSLNPVNLLSDIKGRVYLGWTSAKLHSDASEPQTRGPSVSSQALFLWATAPANYRRRPKFEIMKYHRYIYQEVNHSFMM